MGPNRCFGLWSDVEALQCLISEFDAQVVSMVVLSIDIARPIILFAVLQVFAARLTQYSIMALHLCSGTRDIFGYYFLL
jgi:hypothetical protein